MCISRTVQVLGKQVCRHGKEWSTPVLLKFGGDFVILSYTATRQLHVSLIMRAKDSQMPGTEEIPEKLRGFLLFPSSLSMPVVHFFFHASFYCLRNPETTLGPYSGQNERSDRLACVILHLCQAPQDQRVLKRKNHNKSFPRRGSYGSAGPRIYKPLCRSKTCKKEQQ